MAAPTMDRVLPPIVFLIGLLSTFIVITQAMTPTISNNQQSTFHGPDLVHQPDYMTMFSNNSYRFPNSHPFHIDPAAITTKLVHDYPLGCTRANELVKFTWSYESSHPVTVYAVDKWFGETNRDRHEFYFYQHGGNLGMEDYNYLSRFPQDYTRVTNTSGNSTIEYYQATVYLRHAYNVILSGNYTGGTVYNSIMAWHADMDIYYIDGNASADPWTIVGQFFMFSLPGIPLWLNVLLMTPIMAGIGVLAFIVIRGALPF